LIESELEARFLEALRRVGKEHDDFELRPEFHGGHAGWYARFGDQRYFLQPQVELDGVLGIGVPSRADFVFWPLGLSTAKPIVIFTDGFQYHKDRIALDTAQRMAIIAAGGFWAWSLTYDDVQDVLDNKESLHLGLTLGMPNDNAKTLSGRFQCESLLSLQDKSSFSWLIYLLVDPNQSEWANFTAMVGFIWSQKADKDSLEISLPEYAQQNLAGLATSSITKFIENGSAFGETYQRIQVALALDKAAIQQGKLDQLSTIIVFHDEPALDESELDIKQWQALLRFMNLLQFQLLNGFFTAKGIAEHIYDGIKVSSTVTATAPSNWELLLADAIGSECDIINKLIETGVSVPQLGFELENEMGEIVGEAFLAWIEQKVVMIFDEYESDKVTFANAGWQAFLVSEFELDTQSLVNALGK
jgi:DEAD/DEAH box helicase domain-containing protein